MPARPCSGNAEALGANFMFPPVKEIIPREVPHEIKDILDFFSTALEETVNFGSNIMVWDANPKTKGEENLPPTMLLRHFLDLLDSISILVREGSGDTAKILARAALEVTLYIEYLFEKDTLNRSMAFLVEDTMRQIKLAKKFNSDTVEGKNLFKTFNAENFLKDVKLDNTLLENFIKDKQEMLQLPQFKIANKEFTRLNRSGEGNAKWYRYFDGPKTIESLASYLKQKSLYEIVYRKWSGSVHGTDIYVGKMSTTPEEERIDIFQIRFFKDVKEVVSYALIMGFKVFSDYIFHRVPEKKLEYSRWYPYMRDKHQKVSKTEINIKY
jgi:hypothetical protein